MESPAPGGDALVVAPEAARGGAKVVGTHPDWYPNFPYKVGELERLARRRRHTGQGSPGSGDANISALELLERAGLDVGYHARRLLRRRLGPHLP